MTFGYDPWGNLLQSTLSGPSGCGEPTPLDVYATKGNQLSTSSTQAAGYCYDSAGNLVLNATCPAGSFTPAYSYNAENQLTSTAGVTYTYDDDGKRVLKSNGTLYWYGMSSDPLDETDAQGNTNNSSFSEYIFFNGDIALNGAFIPTMVKTSRANMRDSITGENAVRALDPTRGQKDITSHHNYYEAPQDGYKP